jgi:deoxyribodipyrimidine photo-lyase
VTTGPTVVLFHRDLRVHDHPALSAARAAAAEVVPLFVVDPGLPASPNRLRFLAECLADLRESLRKRGADLVVRHGDPVAEAVRVAADTGAASIAASADVSAYAVARQRRLAEACEQSRLALRLHPGVTLLPPGAVRPTGGDHYRIFTPYWRVWQEQPWRAECPAPARLVLPAGVRGDDPVAVLDPPPATASDRVTGGESAARARLRSWARRAGRYAHQRNDLGTEHTSRLSAYLHFGCVSARTVAGACAAHPEFVRQLAWRDFFHQVLAGFPDLPRRPYRTGATESWRYDEDTLAAWCSGHTGVPIVDAGMRQLAAEGYLHNRARLITASYLTLKLGLDWRDGGRWYMRHLLDGDVANNYGNWQWTAGTGTGSRPYRGFNPIRQARRFDPGGDYVRRWVPELASVAGPAVHEPWLLASWTKLRKTYPPPMGLAWERT